MKRNRSANTNVNYQQRALEFFEGDAVLPASGISLGSGQVGRVVAVFPAIGMVDVEFPWGAQRFPVEDLQRMSSEDVRLPQTNSVPGSGRLARRWVRTALYWESKDRPYRATREEDETGEYKCPRCRRRRGAANATALGITKRKNELGAYEKYLACPDCLFILKKSDVNRR